MFCTTLAHIIEVFDPNEFVRVLHSSVNLDEAYLDSVHSTHFVLTHLFTHDVIANPGDSSSPVIIKRFHVVFAFLTVCACVLRVDGGGDGVGVSGVCHVTWCVWERGRGEGEV